MLLLMFFGKGECTMLQKVYVVMSECSCLNYLIIDLCTYEVLVIPCIYLLELILKSCKGGNDLN